MMVSTANCEYWECDENGRCFSMAYRVFEDHDGDGLAYAIATQSASSEPLNQGIDRLREVIEDVMEDASLPLFFGWHRPFKDFGAVPEYVLLENDEQHEIPAIALENSIFPHEL